MFRTWICTIAVIAVVLCVGTSWAQTFPDTYSVSYYSNQHGTTDGRVRATNPGTANAANLCADIYVFDDTEELLECCGCQMSTNDLRLFDIDKDLTHNAFNGNVPTTGVIKIVSALPNLPNNGCDPTGGDTFNNPTKDNIVPAPDLRAWAVHVQTPFTGTTKTTVTEEEFADSTLTVAELDTLQETCFTNRQLGSGKGVCTCGTGK